uniref:Uncharacterized protein n=1 Tax=Anopheles maculatus TaxID=74869 RepID=A0A182S5H6_9DIPT
MRDECAFVFGKADPNTTQPQATTSSGSTTPPLDANLRKMQFENQELKRKIGQLENVMSIKSFDTAHVKALVEPFSGNDTVPVRLWIEKLESAFRVLKLNKEQQLVAACDLLTETAAIFRKTIPLTGYDELKTKLLQEFAGRKLNDESIIEQLRSHKLVGTNLLRYVMEMVEMAQGYDISEVDLVDIIINGFEDDSHTIVMLYGVQTIAELKSLLPRYEKRRVTKMCHKH